jgi:hypothetical protein
MTQQGNTRARLFTRTKMAEFYQEILKWLDTMSGLMKALPVTQTNSEAMARMYMTMFTMLQSFVERLPISGAAAVAPAKAAPPPTSSRPMDLVRAAAATRLPDEPPPAAFIATATALRPIDVMNRAGAGAEPAGALVRRAANAPPPAAEAPAGSEEESEEERPVTNKISLRAHGYRLSAKDATRFPALEKARAAHGSGTVVKRLQLLLHIWEGHKHTRSAEFVHNILCDIAYLRDMDRRAARRSDE